MSELRRRATSLDVTERFLLEEWACSITAAFGVHPYLVGSVARAEAWRDVDVRLMLDDDVYAQLTNWRTQQAAALNVAMSLWGQRATGLPIDFQFQRTSEANEKHNGIRNPLGLREPSR